MPNRKVELGGRGRPSGVRPVVWNSSFGPWPVRYTNSGAASAIDRDQADHDEARDRDPVAAQARPGQLPRAASLDRALRSRAAESSTSSSGQRAHAGALGGSARAASASSSPSATGKWQAVRWVDGSPPRACERRLGDGALRARLRAARVEAAAGRRVDRRRHVAREQDPARRRRRVGIGHRERREQRRACTGAAGARRASSASAISTILPRYITAIRSLTWRTTERSCAMKT